jgi:hypothetical protein
MMLNAIGDRSRRACDIDERGERLQPVMIVPVKETARTNYHSSLEGEIDSKPSSVRLQTSVTELSSRPPGDKSVTSDQQVGCCQASASPKKNGVLAIPPWAQSKGRTRGCDKRVFDQLERSSIHSMTGCCGVHNCLSDD